MSTSKFSITEGTGKNIATNQINEDGVNKQIQRVVINDENGATISDFAKDGTDATGVTSPTGGVGIRGWLSGIYKNTLDAITSLTTLSNKEIYTTKVMSGTDGALKVVNVDATGNIKSDPNPVLLPNSKGAYATSSYRMIGQIAAPAGTTPFPAPLMTIMNNGTTPKALRRLAIEVLYSAAAVDLAMGNFRLYTNTGITPTGGTLATLHKMDSTYPAMDTGLEVKFGASADGTNTVITHAVPATNAVRQQARTAILTAVGVMPQIDYELVTYSQHPIIIQPGETVALILTSAAIDVITRHYIVKLVVEDLN